MKFDDQAQEPPQRRRPAQVLRELRPARHTAAPEILLRSMCQRWNLEAQSRRQPGVEGRNEEDSWMTITIEQAARARELRYQNFSWEGCARELGFTERKEVSRVARRIRLAIDPEFIQRRQEYEAKRSRIRYEWCYGTRTQLRPREQPRDRPQRPIAGQPDAIVSAIALAFAEHRIDANELSVLLRNRRMPMTQNDAPVAGGNNG